MFEAGVLPETLSFQVIASGGPPPDSAPLPAANDPGWNGALGRVPDGHEFAGVNWSDPIYFRADGTGTDATFLVQNSRGSAYRIMVRETTGEIFVHSVE